MKGENNHEVCELCARRITNPICVGCYMGHVRSWLVDFGLGEKEIREAIRAVKSRLPAETLNKNACVLCGKEQVSVCMFCAFLRTSPILIRLGAGKQELEEYEQSSNFGREYDDKI